MVESVCGEEVQVILLFVKTKERRLMCIDVLTSVRYVLSEEAKLRSQLLQGPKPRSRFAAAKDGSCSSASMSDRQVRKTNHVHGEATAQERRQCFQGEDGAKTKAKCTQWCSILICRTYWPMVCKKVPTEASHCERREGWFIHTSQNIRLALVIDISHCALHEVMSPSNHPAVSFPVSPSFLQIHSR